MTERSPSGLWRLFSPSTPGPSSSPKPSGTSGTHKAVPPSSSTSGLHRAVPSSSTSGLHRAVPSRGLPADPASKAVALLELAEADCQRGQWASAETNLRVALTFAPQERVIQRRLAEVVATRELQRKSAHPTPR